MLHAGDDQHVLQWTDEHLDEPLFVLEDGPTYSYNRIYADFREVLESCEHYGTFVFYCTLCDAKRNAVHNLSTYGFQYHFSHGTTTAWPTSTRLMPWDTSQRLQCTSCKRVTPSSAVYVDTDHRIRTSTTVPSA
jgi:hypothetical protein